MKHSLLAVLWLWCIIFSGCASKVSSMPKATKQTPESVLTHLSKEKMDLKKIPTELHPLVPLVQRWGGVSSDEEVYNLAHVAESDEAYIKELQNWLDSWTDEQHKAYTKWDDANSIVDNKELCKFYFMFMLLGNLEIKAPRSQEDPVNAAIRDLGKMTGTAAVPTRKFAASELAVRGVEAKVALPALRHAAQHDPSDEVRAWCYAALGWIEGKPQAYRQNIEDLLSKATEESRLTIESALVEINRTEKDRGLRRLIGACITNDLKTIEKLLKFVDPNQFNPNHSTPIEFAVGNSNPEALDLLLRAGANPNQSFGKEYVLHNAAGKRLGHQLIKLLLEYKADPWVKNNEGLTPLDVAKKNNRSKSCELLETAMKRTQPKTQAK